MSRTLVSFVFSLCFLLTFAGAQTPATPLATPTASPTPAGSLERKFVQHIIHDQKMIWTSPFRLDGDDAKWALPLGAVAAVTLATDSHTSAWVDRNGGLPVVSRDVSWAGKAWVTGGVAGAFYLAGRGFHNRRARETGVLAAEALIDTGIVTEVLKLSTGRLRPNAENGTGEFLDGGSSFPSGHSSTVWSIATVIAYEYKDKPIIRYGAFAAATAVSMARYSGRNHFLTDILLGSAIGFGIGRYVFKTYHQPDPALAPAKPVTKLIPAVIPYFDGRTHTYGGSLIWRL